MKFLIVSFALVAVAATQQPGVYRGGIEQRAAILRQTQEVTPQGYSYSYETENGIAAAENGALKAVGPQGEPAIVAEGGFQYTSPDGQVISTKYVAGPDGFVAEGAHLPVPPPIPELILRSLEYNAAHPQQEDIDYQRPQPQKLIYKPVPHYAPSTLKPREEVTEQPSTVRPVYPNKPFYPQQPNYFGQPGYPQQPSYLGQPGYPQQPGYYGQQGYRQPGFFNQVRP